MTGEWWVFPALLGIVLFCLVGIMLLTQSQNGGGGGNDDGGDGGGD